MSSALASQKALRARLTGTAAVTALVPAGHILDRNARPTPDPAILLGEDQVLDEGGIARSRERVIATLHVWKKEPSLEGVKQIAGAIQAAIHAGRPVLGAGYHCADCHVSGMRFLRDPDGESSHGVVTVETLVVIL